MIRLLAPGDVLDLRRRPNLELHVAEGVFTVNDTAGHVTYARHLEPALPTGWSRSPDGWVRISAGPHEQLLGSGWLEPATLEHDVVLLCDDEGRPRRWVSRDGVVRRLPRGVVRVRAVETGIWIQTESGDVEAHDGRWRPCGTGYLVEPHEILPAPVRIRGRRLGGSPVSAHDETLAGPGGLFWRHGVASMQAWWMCCVDQAGVCWGVREDGALFMDAADQPSHVELPAPVSALVPRGTGIALAIGDQPMLLKDSTLSPLRRMPRWPRPRLDERVTLLRDSLRIDSDEISMPLSGAWKSGPGWFLWTDSGMLLWRGD